MIQDVVDRLCMEFNIQDRARVYEIVSKKKRPRPKTLEEIAKQVCKRFDITWEQLYAKSPIEYYYKNKRRYRHYVDARMEFAKIARPKAGVREVGKFLGVDYTTVIHYVKYRKSQNPRVTKKAEVVKTIEPLVEAPVVPIQRPPAIYTNIRTNYYGL